MTEKQKVVKWYHLTPKALRHVLATEEYEKKLSELEKLSDEEIVKLAKERSK